jgi:dienelactone hydrolase
MGAVCVAALTVSGELARAGDSALPIGGGYSGQPNVIAIPVKDPEIKAITGALFKPAGAGPFPAIVYMSECAGLSIPADMAVQKQVIDHFMANGVATLIVDPFSPRGEWGGVCEKINDLPYSQRDDKDFVAMAGRGGEDAWAAVAALSAMPDIDANKIFLQGYSFGAISSLFAVDTKNPFKHDAKIAGLIAYYPFCYDTVEPTVATLVLIGEKDDWTLAAACQAVKDKPNLEVVVYPGATHEFATPGLNSEHRGHRMIYDKNAAEEAQKHADAFFATHVK